MGSKNFHAVMFPWFAIGHITPYLHLSNKLAEKGHYITFLIPKKAQTQLEHLNLHPDRIVFRSLKIPRVHGLPLGAETASDIPIGLTHFLASAMDLTRGQVEAWVHDVKPDLVLYDNAYWVPEITKPLGIKTICYNVVSAAAVAISLVPGHDIFSNGKEELAVPPPGYPSTKVMFREHEARTMLFLSQPFGDGITFRERITKALENCDAISIRTCGEVEGEFCDYIGNKFKKKVLLTGLVLPKPDKKAMRLENQWAKWLNRFEPACVVFCAFGSQVILEKDQFQELCLGFELTGLPFLIALKPPTGSTTIDEALPEGFKERVKERGAVYSGWIQQPSILAHPSVGCFVNHCGFGSMWESLMSDCQIVLVPHLGDQILNTRLMTEELKVAVEVKRQNTGWFSKESLRDAITSVMDKNNELGRSVRENHRKWKESLASPGLMGGDMDKFVEGLHDLINFSL